jgi:hypothetical protein
MAIRDVSAANGAELPSSPRDSPHGTTSQRKIAEAIDEPNDLLANCRIEPSQSQGEKRSCSF